VFCRNVLIYFDDASRRIAAQNLYDGLAPGGFLCLGHTESMSRISPLFQVCRTPDAIVYRRPEGDGHA
jgi:chemotaxis protein methyltransferase CheR